MYHQFKPVALEHLKQFVKLLFGIETRFKLLDLRQLGLFRRVRIENVDFDSILESLMQDNVMMPYGIARASYFSAINVFSIKSSPYIF